VVLDALHLARHSPGAIIEGTTTTSVGVGAAGGRGACDL
jgi:hypothetical protein